MFLLSETIAHVLNNPELAQLIKTLSLAFVVIPHGQQFRALMQKELAFNKIGMIETSSVLAGFTFTVVVESVFWCVADGRQHHQLHQYQPFHAGFSPHVGSWRGGWIQSRLECGGCPPDQTEPDYHSRAVSGVCQNPGRQ